MASLANSTKCLKRINTNPQTVLENWRKKEHLQNHFIKIAFPWCKKSDKDTARKENYSQPNIPDKYWYKNSQKKKILANSIQRHIKQITHHGQVGFCPRMHGCFNVEKSINIIGQANRKNNKAIWWSQLMQKKHLMKFNSISW